MGSVMNVGGFAMQVSGDPLEGMSFVAGYQLGKGLERAFYLDAGLYQVELERVFRRHWQCLGHESIVPHPFDYEVFQMAGEEVILARNGDGVLHAMLNVCRHKGAGVCPSHKGNARSFTCPYHAWTYGLDGALKTARVMPKDFDRAAHGLRKLHLRVAEGLVFVCFADTPLAFDAMAEMLAQTVGVYGWGRGKVVARQSYPIAANWKLAIENYVECYHCGPAHPEYSATHVLEQPPEEIEALNAAMAARTAALGLHIMEGSPWEGAASGREAIRSYRYAMKAGVKSASRDGGALAPLMGQFRDFDGGVTSLQFGGMSFMAAYPDHGVIYRFIPKGLDACELEISWVVDAAAEAGRDYDLAELTWLWRVTSEEDKAIIEATARGVASHYYQAGPIAPMEAQTQRFINWYLAEISTP